MPFIVTFVFIILRLCKLALQIEDWWLQRDLHEAIAILRLG